MKTHFRISLVTINFKHLFNEMAQVLNYPDWIYLPDRIETEIRYLFQNCEKEHLIHKLSMFLQTPWDKHFNQLKNDQVSSMNNIYVRVGDSIDITSILISGV